MAEKKKRVKYDINLLTTFCAENNVELLKDYSKEKITSETRIEGKCVNCVNSFNKLFESLYKFNSYYCNYCYQKIIKEKMKKNCLKTYGVEHTTQLQEVRDKMKNTMIKIHGVQHALQSKEINKI